MAHVLAKDLRDAVLQAAVQGRLSRTLSSDTPVYQTIENFKHEKNQLLSHKNMKDRNKFQDIDDEEHLFDIPADWTWIRINDIGVFKKGPFGSALTKSMFVKKSSTTIKVYEQKNAIQKNHLLGDYYITEEYYNSKMKGFKVEPGDIIVSCAGTIGEVYIIPENAESGIINQALMRMNIIDSINLDYFMIVFEHILKEEARSNSGGTAIKNIPPFDVFKALPFPLPPIEEQARIVAKVDELMAKIDEYEKLENELVELKKNFPGDMKAAVLQAAMEGRFSGNNYSFEDNPELYKPLWSLTAWDKKFKNVDKSKQKIVKDYHYYLASEMRSVRCDTGDIFLLSTGDYEGWTTVDKVHDTYSEGEIVSMPWGGTPKIKYFKGKFITSDNRIATSLDANVLNNKYLYYFMLSNMEYLDSIYRGTGLRHPDMSAVLDMNIPLPPIEEQQRIVEKLDKLLPLCDALCDA